MFIKEAFSENLEVSSVFFSFEISECFTITILENISRPLFLCCNFEYVVTWVTIVTLTKSAYYTLLHCRRAIGLQNWNAVIK